MKAPAFRVLALSFVAAVAAGCSGGGVNTTPVASSAGQQGGSNATPTPAPTTGASTTPSAAPTAAPTTVASPTPTPSPVPTASPTAVALAACTGQTTTATSSSASQTLSTSGGFICIPSFGGFGGTIAYPTVSSPVSVTLTTSTTNVGSYPTLGTATPILYLNVALSGGTNFGSGAAGGGLVASSALISVGTTYTVYGRATILGFPLNFTPCQTVATAGTGGGVISGLGTVLNNAQIPVAASGIIEIEPGASGSGPC